MTREEALERLSDPDLAVRLVASRTLARTAQMGDLPRIQAALGTESDRWVRRHLNRATRFASDRRTNRRRLLGLASAKEVGDELFGIAVAEVTRLLLHEVNVLIGDIRRHAEREVGSAATSFKESRTKKSIDRIDRLTSAIATLNQAASPATLTEVDISAVLVRLADSCAERMHYPVEPIGQAPALVWTDQDLLELAVDQGLRNAVEASREAGSTAPVRLVWRVHNNTYDVLVLDSGRGLPKGFDHSFRTISTNKDKRQHQGIGLLIASRAAASIGGQMAIAPRADGGCEFSLLAPTSPGVS